MQLPRSRAPARKEERTGQRGRRACSGRFPSVRRCRGPRAPSAGPRRRAHRHKPLGCLLVPHRAGWGPWIPSALGGGGICGSGVQEESSRTESSFGVPMRFPLTRVFFGGRGGLHCPGSRPLPRGSSLVSGAPRAQSPKATRRERSSEPPLRPPAPRPARRPATLSCRILAADRARAGVQRGPWTSWRAPPKLQHGKPCPLGYLQSVT